MTTTLSVPERVANGIVWLDATVPHWRNAVYIIDLNMQSACKCVLGQVFAEESEDPDYITGFDIGLERAGDDYSGKWAIEHGFDAVRGTTESDFAELQAEWERVLAP